MNLCDVVTHTAERFHDVSAVRFRDRRPAGVRRDTLALEQDDEGGTWLVDDVGFRMDLREHWVA
jgi:hypothetical protein